MRRITRPNAYSDGRHSAARRPARRAPRPDNSHSAAGLAPPPSDGDHREAAPAPAAATAPSLPLGGPKGKRRRLLLLLPILLVVGGVSTAIAYRYWYESTYFVMTDNAQVTGDLVQVGSLTPGRIIATHVEVGDMVQKDQVIAVVAVPQQVGTVPFSDAPRLDQTGSLNAQVPVRAPLAGMVAARMGAVGGTVSAGQAIYALVDPKRIWINANVEEAKVGRVRPGQPAEVHVDALGQTFPGRVVAVTPATAATFSLLPSQNVSGNFTKVTQWVPVKIAVDSGDTILPLGASVEVRIRVQ
ncbi:MAG TPA: efflux RND transporter periplasmic adaptor subunit [Chloroflexota bacterium]|nr:efflux RND transporter periplasmic adaptor subunit [Chloroflexota bacterium]